MNSKLLDIVACIRKHTFLPVAVGFGVATRLHCNAAIEAGADDVVVGGCTVSLIKPAPADQVPQVVRTPAEDSRDRCLPTPLLPEFKTRNIIALSSQEVLDGLE